MCELANMFERVKIENLMSYLIGGATDREKRMDDYEQKIEKSYDNLFEKLEGLSSKINRHDDNLFDVVTDFATIHDDVYFETGVVIGFQLYKNMEHDYKCVVGENREKKDESILEMFFGVRADTALEETLRTNMAYQKVSEEIHEKIKEIDNIQLTHRQWNIVDRALSACNERSAEYGKVAYCQGFGDAVKLLKEICRLL